MRELSWSGLEPVCVCVWVWGGGGGEGGVRDEHAQSVHYVTTGYEYITKPTSVTNRWQYKKQLSLPTQMPILGCPHHSR